jgi:hypothetical protein
MSACRSAGCGRGEYTHDVPVGQHAAFHKLENLPKAKFYKIETGRRQGPTFSYEDMERDNWSLVLSLG